MITEKFSLTGGFDELCTVLGKYIVSVMVNGVLTSDSTRGLSDDDVLVKGELFKRTTDEYIKLGKSKFKLVKAKEKTDFGIAKAKFVCLDAKKGFPEIYLIINNNIPVYSNGHVINSDGKMLTIVTFNLHLATKHFEESVLNVTETIKHEVRHVIQIKDKIGFPKSKILAKDRDVYGISVKDKQDRIDHPLQDIEFKTNVHTYAEHIKNHLNANFPKNKWKFVFKDMIFPAHYYMYYDPVYRVLEYLSLVRKKDPARWKQYVTEIYKLIF